MHLKHFVISVLLFYALSVFGGVFFYRLAVVYPQLQAQAVNNHQTDFKALQKVLDNEAENASLLLNDWAKWDDMYEYIHTPTDEFIASNFSSSILSDTNLSGIYLYHADKTMHLGIEIEAEGKHIFTASQLASDRYKQIPAQAWPTNGDINCHYIYGNQLYFNCISIIQNSEENLEPNGFLIFSRVINTERQHEISVITGVDFSVLPAKGPLANVMSIDTTLTQSNISDHYDLGFKNNLENDYAFLIHIEYPKSSLPVPIDNQIILMSFVLLLLPIVIIYVFSRLLLNPLTYMSELILAAKDGDKTHKLPKSGFIVEIKIFNRALLEFIDHVEKERLTLENRSLTDALTGVSNRRAFDEEMEKLWRGAARHTKPIAIIFIDIDYFKKFNDSLGHQKGDEALKAVALALRGMCRRSYDQVFRYGGEEFAISVLLDDVEDLPLMVESIQHSVDLLSYPHPSSPVSNNLTVSMGVSLIAQPGGWMQRHSYEEAVKVADKALYEAKGSGRNTYVAYSFSGDQIEFIGQKQDFDLLSKPDIND